MSASDSQTGDGEVKVWTSEQARTPRFTVRGALGKLGSLVMVVGLVIALIMVAHIALVLGKANPANSVAILINHWAERLDFGLGQLFLVPDDPTITVMVNYTTVAIIWLVIGLVLGGLIRRI
ncbi:hypothetical protein [Pseudonocardia spinosispora]|uniref:hypothetical protein n=1 Tax=Pseudonocardia spinosispora TaxID=103441 RepID=UPI0003F872ED|nr:hypothetical protein [Pseudonocardia spinosispora]